MTFEPSRLVSYDRDAILAEIRRVVGQFFGGRSPSHAEFNRFSRMHSNTAVREFGSWPAAIRAAGIEFSRSRINAADLVADLKKMLQVAGGKHFTEDFYQKNGGRYSVKTLKARLGHPRWSELLEKVLGVPSVRKIVVRPARKVVVKKSRRSPLSRDELLQELGKVRNELGRRPTCGEFQSRSAIGLGAFERAFGSWASAVTEFASKTGSAVQYVKGTRCTRGLLLSEIQSAAAKKDGIIFSYSDYRDVGGTYPIWTFQKHFGSWKNAVAAIGRKHGHSLPHPAVRTLSDEQFFSEMQRVWEALGRQPKAREMRRNGSIISAKAFQYRFGGWMRAIHAFCEDRNPADVNREEAPQNDELIASEPSGDRTASLFGAAELKPGVVMIEKRTPRQPSLRLRFRVFQRDRFSCQACGRSPATEPGVVLHVDHIIPYSDLGETVLENLQTLCSRCNLGKSDLILRNSRPNSGDK
ncbi:MAG: HNH endonuclease [Thermoguttaceae bacterium]